MGQIIYITVGLSLLMTLPAAAQLGRVWTEFQVYSVDMQNYLLNNLSASLNPLEIRTQNALTAATGEANIPNPIAAEKSFNQDILFNSVINKFENNPIIQGNAITQEINRLITRSAVEGTMGRDGQLRLKTKLQNTENSLNDITQMSDNSNNIFQTISNTLTSLYPTEPLRASLESGQANLQLQSIKIQQEQAKISGETLAQSIQTHQSLQYSNLNLVNIAQQMEEINRARRVDGATEAARLLRTTAQLDLLGRENN